MRRHSQRVPTPVTAFVGRADEKEELSTHLSRERLVTVVGVGGAGKTRLAAEVALAMSGDFDGGVVWLDLAGLSDAGSVLPAALSALGLRATRADVPEDLVAGLGGRPLLMVLDNCEHVVGAAAGVAGLLTTACPAVRVLATSREPLRAAGEQVFALGGLAVPQPGATAESVDESEAVQLFLHRARHVNPQFRVDDRSRWSVAEICLRLDGLPLAIELAAARVRHLSSAQIVEGLDDRFGLLTGGVRTAEPRHRTLEASIDWSYDLLTEPQRALLARLSVFAGPFGLDAATEVGAVAPVDAGVRDALADLIDRSLVHVDDASDGYRYRLLQTINAYGARRLADRGETTLMRDRHLDHHLRLAGAAEEGLASDDFKEWLEWLTPLADDLRAAMDHAIASGRSPAAVEIAVRTANFWQVLGFFTEMHRRLRLAADASPTKRERAKACTTGSILALMGGDYAAGYELAAEAVVLSRGGDDPETLTRALINRPWTGFFSGEAGSDAIWSDLDNADDIVASTGDEGLALRLSLNRAALELVGESLPAGTAKLELVVRAVVAADAAPMETTARTFLAYWGVLDGNTPRARRHGRRALELARSMGNHAFVSMALCGLAVADILTGDRQSADRQLAEARQVAGDAGLDTFEMIAQRITAQAALRFGDESARRLAEEALGAARGVSSAWDVAGCGYLAGVAAIGDGDLDGAHVLLRESHDASLDPLFPLPLGHALLGLSHLAYIEVDLDRARDLAHDALDTFAVWGGPIGVADALEAVAAIDQAGEQMPRAVRVLAAAERFRRTKSLGRFPMEAERYQQMTASLGQELSGPEFQRCWAEGERLSLHEAVAYSRRGRGEQSGVGHGWPSVTPAELRVTALVAGGLTNPQIAERLFVSRNTVKTHLSHIYAKLGIANRAALAAEAARRDQDQRLG
jgi:predicted ATPase/DNA-binding CsgD family transcriptional regulator